MDGAASSSAVDAELPVSRVEAMPEGGSSGTDKQQLQQHANSSCPVQSETFKIAPLPGSKATSSIHTARFKRLKSSSKQTSSAAVALPLGDLPQPALSILMRCVQHRYFYHNDSKGPSPLLNIMKTSKKMAQAVLEALPHHHCKLDRQANWIGVRKVLMWDQVTTLHLDITGALPIPPLSGDVKALTMLLGHHPIRFTKNALSTSQFAGVRHVTIKSDWLSPELPWLLPPSLVTCCPNLKSLHLQCPSFRQDPPHGRHEDPLLVTCTSLTSLSLQDCLKLPAAANHSSEQLRRAMPNINHLTFSGTPMVAAERLLKAWGTVLTALTVDTLTDEWMEQLLKLPKVTKLQFRDSRITRDWRAQAQHLGWTELVVRTTDWLHLSWLPLQRLEKISSMDGKNLVIEISRHLDPERARIASKALEKGMSVFKGADEVALYFPDRKHDDDGCCGKDQMVQLPGCVASVLHRASIRRLQLNGGGLHHELVAAACKQFPNLAHVSIFVDTLMDRALTDMLAEVGNNCTRLTSLAVLERATPEYASADEEDMVREVFGIVNAVQGLATRQQSFLLTLQGCLAVSLMKKQQARTCFEQLLRTMLPKHTKARCMYQYSPRVDRIWGHLMVNFMAIK